MCATICLSLNEFWLTKSARRHKMAVYVLPREPANRLINRAKQNGKMLRIGNFIYYWPQTSENGFTQKNEVLIAGQNWRPMFPQLALMFR